MIKKLTLLFYSAVLMLYLTACAAPKPAQQATEEDTSEELEFTEDAEEGTEEVTTEEAPAEEATTEETTTTEEAPKAEAEKAPLEETAKAPQAETAKE
ncbi:MAG: carboxypeptidase [bacterium]|nr:MAG: carboxypeptidase [bacterium]